MSLWRRWQDRRDWINARRAEYMSNRQIDHDLAERLASEDWDNGPGRAVSPTGAQDSKPAATRRNDRA